LKQSCAKWNDKLNDIIKFRYKGLISEPCLYVKFNKGKFLSMLTIYVDDILISKSKKIIKRVKLLIKKKFIIKDRGNINYIIRIKFLKHKNCYFSYKYKYIDILLSLI